VVLDATDKAEIKQSVDAALAGWQPPAADSKWNGYIWVLGVGALAVLLIAFGLSFVYIELGNGNSDDLNPILTLLVGGFLGFVGGTKAATASIPEKKQVLT
jgi:hypothetical protein